MRRKRYRKLLRELQESLGTLNDIEFHKRFAGYDDVWWMMLMRRVPDALRDYRSRETWGNAFRKPSRYGALVSPDVDEPFTRVNATGEEFHQRRSLVGRESG